MITMDGDFGANNSSPTPRSFNKKTWYKSWGEFVGSPFASCLAFQVLDVFVEKTRKISKHPNPPHISPPPFTSLPALL